MIRRALQIFGDTLAALSLFLMLAGAHFIAFGLGF